MLVRYHLTFPKLSFSIHKVGLTIPFVLGLLLKVSINKGFHRLMGTVQKEVDSLLW